MSELPPVRRDDAAGRFEMVVDGLVGELTYRRMGERLVLVHTGVPDAIGHRGIAASLAEAAFEYAEAEGLRVVPQCPYVRAWLDDHPEWRERVVVEPV